MASYSIRIKDKNTVYVAFTHEGKETLVKTPVKLAKKDSRKTKEGWVMAKPQLYDAESINEELISIHELALKVIKKFTRQKDPFTSKNLKQHFEKEAPWFISKKKTEPENSFDVIFDEWIGSMKRRQLAPNTLRTRKVLKSLLKDYFGSNINIEVLTEKNINKFREWMYEIRNFQPSNAEKRITHLKLFIKFTQGIEPRQRSQASFDKEIIFLDKSELQKIIDLDVSGAPYLQRAKDAFLMLCYTGLRHSDIALNKSHLRAGFVVKSTQKTDKVVRIPLHAAAKEILEKYDYELPKISQQKLNEYIKILARKAGITEPIEVVSYPGRAKKIEIKEKCDVISTHTGRRTFITYLLSEGLNVHEVMKMTGQSLPVIMKYAGVIDKKLEDKVHKAFDKISR